MDENNIKDMQIDMLSQTIGSLYKEISELRSALVVLQEEKQSKGEDDQ